MDWLEQNAWAAWLGLALALGAVEAATADFVFIMLAGGAAAGAGAAAFGASFTVQVIVAVVVGVALLVLVRPEAKRRLLRGTPPVALGTESYVGRSAEALQDITARGGLIRLGGEEWSARLSDNAVPVPAGSRVHVVSIDGATAVVRPEDAPPPRPESLGE